MFSNSKSYNTNKRSRIYAMTLRLSAMFSERINDILTTWKTAMKQHRKRHPNRYEENRHTGEVALFWKYLSMARKSFDPILSLRISFARRAFYVGAIRLWDMDLWGLIRAGFLYLHNHTLLCQMDCLILVKLFHTWCCYKGSQFVRQAFHFRKDVFESSYILKSISISVGPLWYYVLDWHCVMDKYVLC